MIRKNQDVLLVFSSYSQIVSVPVQFIQNKGIFLFPLTKNMINLGWNSFNICGLFYIKEHILNQSRFFSSNKMLWFKHELVLGKLESPYVILLKRFRQPWPEDCKAWGEGSAEHSGALFHILNKLKLWEILYSRGRKTVLFYHQVDHFFNWPYCKKCFLLTFDRRGNFMSKGRESVNAFPIPLQTISFCHSASLFPLSLPR